MGFQKTHGKSHLRIYRTWQDMNDRCKNPNNPYWSRYGGRGIKVCEEWLYSTIDGFMNFYNDMSPTYFNKGTIDRIKNDQGYSKNNCQWLTRAENTSKAFKGITLSNETKMRMSVSKTKLTPDMLLDIFEYLETHNLDEAIEKFKVSKSTINRHFRESNLCKPVKKKESRYTTPQSIIDEVQKINILIDSGLSMTKACEISNISRPTYRKYKDI